MASCVDNVGDIACPLEGKWVRKRKEGDQLHFRTWNIEALKGKFIELVRILHSTQDKQL